MENHVHIHEVLHFLADTKNDYTDAGLVAEVKEMYGDDVTFGTCANHALIPEQIVDFMLNRGKIFRDGELIKLNKMEETCD
ncbi:DUF2492 family protein [Flammeovirgaceae bacterium SG7u.111]|nr:DUF2492 family protein [Flammeovirgaceae bacterium SG7u.132]WPO33560.1 DUF2492 family protein [Flammeovirgaceae bacterium SG7u.111]